MSQICRARARSLAGCTILDIEGDLTHEAEAPLLAALQAPHLAQHTRLLLNFANVGYINSAGISLLVSLIVEMRASGRVLIACSLTPHYQKIFKMVGLTRFLKVYESEAAALEAQAESPEG